MVHVVEIQFWEDNGIGRGTGSDPGSYGWPLVALSGHMVSSGLFSSLTPLTPNLHHSLAVGTGSPLGDFPSHLEALIDTKPTLDAR